MERNKRAEMTDQHIERHSRSDKGLIFVTKNASRKKKCKQVEKVTVDENLEWTSQFILFDGIAKST